LKLRHFFTRPARAVLRASGFEVIRIQDLQRILSLPSDFSSQDIEDAQRVSKYTMVPPERIFTLARAVEYTHRSGIPGAFVECGSWKGGCVMAMARTLMRLGVNNRDLYVYDLFGAQWPASTEHDRHRGMSAHENYERMTEDQRGAMCYSQEEVRVNVLSTGYPSERVHLIQGDVRHTISAQAPEKIALLRLDTDYYESTLHELEQLYPRLVLGGTLIVDDYGDWEGARKATDEYFARIGHNLHLIRVDAGARMAVKTHE